MTDPSPLAPSFAALGVPDELVSALTQASFTKPLPVQDAVIPPAMRSEDVVATAETGSGKTLAFLIPLLAHLLSRRAVPGPHALILAPTRELAGQIAGVARTLTEPLGIASTLIHGGVGFGHQIQDLQDGTHLVIATPGRLLDLLNKGVALLGGVERVVLDEADRMLEMGFVEDVTAILGATHPDRRTILCSATLDGRVEKFVARHLADASRADLAGDDGRALPAGLTHWLAEVRMPLKRLLLVHRLQDPAWRAVLVFVKSRFRCHALAGALIEAGIEAAPLHAQLSQSERTATFERFREGTLRVLVATDLAERGLDVPDVSHVVNFDPPRSPEGYIHRVGRTARLQGEGEAYTFSASAELSDVQMMAARLGFKFERFQDAEFEYGQRPEGLDPLVDRRTKRKRPGSDAGADGDKPRRKSAWKGNQPAAKAEFWARIRAKREAKGAFLGRGNGGKRKKPGTRTGRRRRKN